MALDLDSVRPHPQRIREQDQGFHAKSMCVNPILFDERGSNSQGLECLLDDVLSIPAMTGGMRFGGTCKVARP